MKSGVNAKVVDAFDINDKANDVYELNFGHRPRQVCSFRKIVYTDCFAFMSRMMGSSFNTGTPSLPCNIFNLKTLSILTLISPVYKDTATFCY